MFNDYIRKYDYSASYHRVIPSCKHFSLFINRWTFTFVAMVFVWCIGMTVGLILAGVAGAIITIIVCIIFIGIDITTCFIGYKIERYYISDVIQLEQAYNDMPRSKKKEYAKFLIACYKAGDDTIMYTQAIKLFQSFVITQVSKNTVRADLNTELHNVLSAQKLATQIYNESMKNDS